MVYELEMFAILLLLFTVVPALEIYLMIEVGSQIGGINTISIVILTGIIGASLAKSQGLSILQKIQRDLNKGALPADQIVQGFLVFAGGLLLLTPGFLTDLLGLSMVFPGTRHILVKFLKGKLEKGMQNGNIFFSSTTFNSHGHYTHHNENEFSENQFNSQNNVIEVDFVEKKTKDE